MSALLTSVFSQGVKGMADAVGEIVDKFHLSPEAKAEINAKAAELAFDEDKLKSEERVELAKIQAALSTTNSTENVELNKQASDNIKAEIQSPDAYVRRARATPVWIICASWVANYFFIPIAHIFNPTIQPVPLPVEYWAAATAIILGYTVSRNSDRTLGGKGGEVSFMGIKMKSNGD